MSAAAVAAGLACRPAAPGEPAPRVDPLVALPLPPPIDIESLLDSLPLRDRIAQLVWPWLPGTYTAYDDADYQSTVARWIDSLRVGGVLVSIGSPLDIAAKLNDLQRRSRLPLLVGSDLESGTSFRFVGGTPTPPNMAVGAAARDDDAYALGRITGIEGRAVGVHLAFAPVADVNNNPANPVINTRSFGEDPRAVGRLVAAAIRGLQQHGMLATAKHFPGHGNTDTDTHLALPTLPGTWAALDSVELVPFRAAIEAGVAAVMSAHIALPGLDGGRIQPATLTRGVLTGILRDSLGFDGLVITDALNMGSLVANFSAAEVAVRAIEAGADVLLQPADPRIPIDAVEAAVRSGRISMARLDRSVRKVLQAKLRVGLFARRTVSLDSIPVKVGTREHQEIADAIARRTIVLVRDSGAVLDSLRGGPRALALVTYGDDRSPQVGRWMAGELRSRGYRVGLFRLWPNSGPASYDSAAAVLRAHPIAVFVGAVRPYPWRVGRIALSAAMAALVEHTARERPTTLVSLGSPYLLDQTPSVHAYILGWQSNPTMERAVAAALSGAAITGTLPITIGPELPVGAGLQRPILDQASR